MRNSVAIAIVLILSAATVGAAPGEPPQMCEPVTFAHAGVSFSVPKGFAFAGTGGASDVATAILAIKDKPVQTVSLTARLFTGSPTAEAFAGAALKDMRTNRLAVRHLKVLKKTPITVGGVAGVGRRISYTFRGKKSVAAMACFVRPLKGMDLTLCYMLTVETLPAHEARLLPVLDSVIKTVKLVPPAHPTSLPVETLAEPVASDDGDYTLRRPHGWYVVPNQGTVMVAQCDFLQQSFSSVRAWVAALPLRPGTTAEQYVDGCITKGAHVAGKSPDYVRKLVSRRAAKLAGRKAQQFTVMLSPKPKPAASSAPATSAPAVRQPEPRSQILVQRVICVPGRRPDKDLSYSLFLFHYSTDVQAAKAMIDKIAEGFSLAAPAATKPKAADK